VKIFHKLIEDETIFTDGESGMIAFIVFPMFMNHSHLVAQELFWWVDEDKRGTKLGLELLDRAEKEAEKLGAKDMLMLSLNDLNGDKVNKLYESKGYKPREVTYMRAL
jgi:GNAT superfamily N-acetyltransferase